MVVCDTKYLLLILDNIKNILKIWLAVLCFVSIARAQDNELSDTNQTYDLEAVITGDSYIKVNEEITFSAKDSVYDQGQPVKFIWDLGDGTVVEGKEIHHTYLKAVPHYISLTIEQGDKKSSIDSVVFVYKKIMVMITDKKDKHDKLLRIREKLASKGVLIKLIENLEDNKTINSMDILLRQMKENIDAIKDSNLVFVWPNRPIDFGLITTFYRETGQKDLNYVNKTFVFITNEGLGNISKYSQNIYDVLEPEQIVITREDAFDSSLLEKETVKEYITDLYTEYKIINEESRGLLIFNFVSKVVQYMLENGFPDTIMLILLFPIIATIIAFSRQVIGITTFGVYTPSMVTLSFIVMSLKFGLIIFFIILIAGSLIRLTISKFRLLYTPKVAIILTGASFVILMSMSAGTYYKIADITALTIFPMIIMITLSEKFMSTQSGKGFVSAIVSTLETLIVSLVCYFIVTLDIVQTFVLGNPGWMFLIVIIINILLGRYTGLRLSEYARFREVFKHMEE